MVTLCMADKSIKDQGVESRRRARDAARFPEGIPLIFES
jgi:hypothetical protein